MNRVAVVNQKGGVGKTTTVANLGAALARRGRRVLLVDLDPQANLTVHMGLDPNALERTVYHVLTGDATISETVRPAAEDSLHVVPSQIDLASAELELVSMMRREGLLWDALSEHFADGNEYDDLLIDCPPSMGLLCINGLCSAEHVLIPLQAEFFALQGVAKILEVVDLVAKRLQPGLRLSGVIPCRVNERTKLAQEVLGEIQDFFGDRVWSTRIRRNVRLAEAPSHGTSIFAYDPESNGAADFEALAGEYMERFCREPEPGPEDALDQAESNGGVSAVEPSEVEPSAPLTGAPQPQS